MVKFRIRKDRGEGEPDVKMLSKKETEKMEKKKKEEDEIKGGGQ